MIDDLIQNEESSILSKIGLPNTKNVIKKWSMEHFHGLDLSEFALPPDARQRQLVNIPRVAALESNLTGV